jgi:hypothetical protein
MSNAMSAGISPERASYIAELLLDELRGDAVHCKTGKPCGGRCIPKEWNCTKAKVGASIRNTINPKQGLKNLVAAGAGAALVGAAKKYATGEAEKFQREKYKEEVPDNRTLGGDDKRERKKRVKTVNVKAERVDARKCDKGKPCGQRCIPKNWECRSEDKDFGEFANQRGRQGRRKLARNKAIQAGVLVGAGLGAKAATHHLKKSKEKAIAEKMGKSTSSQGQPKAERPKARSRKFDPDSAPASQTVDTTATEVDEKKKKRSDSLRQIARDYKMVTA